MKALKLIFTAAVFVTMSLGVQAQDSPRTIHQSVETHHLEYRSDAGKDSGKGVNLPPHEVSENKGIPFYARFVSAVFRWRLF